MLQNLTDKINACLEHCREAADDEPDERVRQQLIDLEKQWQDLARSYEFIETLEQFLFASRALPPEVDKLPKDYPPE